MLIEQPLDKSAYNSLYGVLPFLPFWIALLIAGLAAYPTYRMLLAMKSRQTVSQYAPEGHQKKQGTPTMGGLIIVLGTLVSLVAFLVVSRIAKPEEPGLNAWFSAVLILLCGFAFIGFVDDFLIPRLVAGKRGLGWKQKILMQIVAAVVAAGLILDWHFEVQFFVYVFLILFCSNAFNFLDGLDALAGSVLLALAAGLSALSTQVGTSGTNQVILCALAGAAIPFLILNAPPAKVFMGDVGSLPVGALLGLVFSALVWPTWGPYTMVAGWVDAGFRPAMVIPAVLVGLVLIAELVPVPLQILWVKVFKRRLFSFTPIHHAFEKAGWPESRVVWFFLITQIVLGAAAYTWATGARGHFIGAWRSVYDYGWRSYGP